MFNFLAACGLCSSIPKHGDHAYEVYSKLPPAEGTMQVNGRGQESSVVRPVGWKEQSQHYINNVPISSALAGEYTFGQLLVNNSKNICVRQVLKSNYVGLVRKHEESGQKFTDPQFPPDHNSIGDVEDLRMRATWKRIPDVVKQPVFVDARIDPGSVFQGSLGDGYFLSAISALSEKDYRIKNLFSELRLNRHGIYMAKVLFRGVLREVVVDDYIPVNQQGDPLFAKPAGSRQIWIMILQKCWAKLHGSYGAIVGGLPNQVLHAFSWAPTFFNEITSNKQQTDALWWKVAQAFGKREVVCCGTKSEEEVQKFGLLRGHAYTLVGVYDRPYRMVRLRNPWGGPEWKGRGCESDKQFWANVTPADRQIIGLTEKNNGTFFILWDDLVNLFDMADICKVNDNANISYCEGDFNRRNAQIFEFDTAGGNITLALSQKNLRGMGQNIERKGYSRSVIIVGKQEFDNDGYQYKYITSSSSNLYLQHTLQFKDLPAGKYVVYAKVNWVNTTSDRACVGLYSDSPIHLSFSKQSKHKNFLYKIFLDHARNNNKRQPIQPGEWICNDLLLSECGYGYIAIHLDPNSTRKLGVQIEESDYLQRRLVLKKPYRGSGQLKVSVQPGEELIILFRIKSQNFPNSVTLPPPKIYNLL